MSSELFYRAVRAFGTAIFRLASTPRILHAERVPATGACLLAANHTCAYDAPLLIAATPRMIHWLSIVEIFRHPLARWFLTAFGALPLDRSKVDTTTVRKLARLLKAGEVVGIFPEGGMRFDEDSVLASGGIDSGVCKLAQLAGVAVLPCVVLGGEQFRRWTNWLPGAHTPWTVAFGELIPPRMDPDRAAARVAMAEEITQALRALRLEVIGYA
ncbi:phospholipid/glycerol acyltransferase [Chthoniobacter flavus Ellin428]|uniref:Phospholipid/glycerol acyltransferase n=1 Tax=Chthoniobacter flavus Ellin428 TaxID=497964 RepID=B4CWA2_9BACT|nr:lysophospholipid acyltransferase family protein [Chthoniobacter flavus]EDY21694.1 phospholipid/glycerol acyltransferase [Chthoniobacter flavus Ellin428]TCO95631.1 1-acyl-sn-glycerol-3-phosphate acyltransferase [Chthoniobacter flavus]